jgi:hypothetical protein
MSYLRFLPAEYQAIAGVAAQLDFVPGLHDLKNLLVAALTETEPASAGKIARLKARHLQVLRDHLWGRPPSFPVVSLTAEEVGMLEEAFGPLLVHSRFRRPLQRVLARRLLGECPALGHKLHSLSPEQFDELCEYVRQKTKGG